MAVIRGGVDVLLQKKRTVGEEQEEEEPDVWWRGERQEMRERRPERWTGTAVGSDWEGSRPNMDTLLQTPAQHKLNRKSLGSCGSVESSQLMKLTNKTQQQPSQIGKKHSEEENTHLFGAILTIERATGGQRSRSGGLGV